MKIIEKEIKDMPNYFADYDTIVHFISEEELKANHSGIPHGGFVIRSGKTGWNLEHNHLIEYSLKLDSNPEFTASVIVACARAAVRMKAEGMKGCKTIFDIPPAYLCNISAEDMPEKISSRPLPLRNAAIVTAELTAGTVIAQIIDHEQMAWIMLTILFIHLAESPQTPPADLAGKRVIATLPGIIFGGMYLSAFCSVNYRMIYIVPFSGALSFFVLYLKNDYFLFTLLFMFSVTLFADWLPGNGRGFVFTEMMFVRSLAAVIGAVLLLCGENLMQKEMVS